MTEPITPDPLTILTVTAEYAPFASVGELAARVGALTEALAGQGHRLLTFLPRYRSIDPELLRGFEPVHQVRLPMQGETVTGTIWRGRRPASPVLVYLVEQDGLFGRDGIYADPATGAPYPDDARRFVFFCRAVVETLRGLKLKPDVVHAHDHQAALVLAYLKTIYSEDAHLRDVASLFSIHDLAVQGLYSAETLEFSGLPPDVFHSMSPFEFWGKMNLMKIGISFADLVCAASPRYAREMTWSSEFGFGLEGMLRERQHDVIGILHGVDTQSWDPATDASLAARYSIEDMAGKAACKKDLCKRIGFDLDPDTPVIAFVGALDGAHGLELLREAESVLLERHARWLIVGSGEAYWNDYVRDLCTRHPDRVATHPGDDAAFEHCTLAGADLCLVPARHDPAGGVERRALRYGTLPIVRSTGALADTVADFSPPAGDGNGFTFTGFTAEDLVAAVDRALDAWNMPDQRAHLRRRAMGGDYSWAEAARETVEAYEIARARKRQANIGSWSSGTMEHR